MVLKELDRLGAGEHRSRAALIREAVAAYLDRRGPRLADRVGFGVWREKPVDGLEYERRLREQWDQ